MLLAARREAGLQRHGWIVPLSGFAGGWGSLLSMRGQDELAKFLAVIVLVSWAWLCIQPSVRHKFDKINCRQVNRDAVNRVTQAIQQGILFFSLPFLVLATQMQAPGQIFVTGFVVLAALLSTVDAMYQKLIANQQMPFVVFHCLCSFIVSLIVLPIVVAIPEDKSFTIALLLVLLWLVVGAPLNRRHHELSVRVFMIALLFPLGVWSLKNHIPPIGTLMENPAVSLETANREATQTAVEVNLAQLEQDLFAYPSSKVPPADPNQGMVLDWRYGAYSDNRASTIMSGHEDGYRTYGLKHDFVPDASLHWSANTFTPESLTLESQMLEHVDFDIIPEHVYSPAFTVPRAELSTPRVTGLVIKPSM
jgi:hypothetical protein